MWFRLIQELEDWFKEDKKQGDLIMPQISFLVDEEEQVTRWRNQRSFLAKEPSSNKIIILV